MTGLKRIPDGGELNGVWTPATRKAMKAFTDRINAVLPVEDPDTILLALVQGHQGEGCGKPCPASQGLSEDGRCLPTAVLAHVAKKAAPPAEAVSSRGRPPVEQPAPAVAGWSTTTAAALPSPPTGAPLAGRMALAGPNVNAGAGALTAAPAPPSPGKTAGTQRHAPRARSYERPYYAQRAQGRSRFVESFLHGYTGFNRF